MTTQPVRTPSASRRPARTLLALLGAALATAAAVVGPSAPATAHGFSSVAYVDATTTPDGVVRTAIDLEYDLLVVSAADAQHDDALFEDGDGAFQATDDATALAAALHRHAETVVAYVTRRFSVETPQDACTPDPAGDLTVHWRDVPYATLTLDWTCPAGFAANRQLEEGAHVVHGGHVVRSGLFPDAEGYVTGTKTIVTYDLDDRTGSAALDASRPEFSTEQTLPQRFAEFFSLGALHLLTGLDHILFLVALIVGSRRLRDVVLAATSFTVAHSVTFVLAALGAVHVSSDFVEPTIALSISAVAAWHLWRTWARRRPVQDSLAAPTGPLGLDGADWLRLAVVFCFGLVHGLGFAGALGIDAAWSWSLLWSLLVFNVGIEAVQLGIIAVVFPLLALLGRRSPVVGTVVGAVVAAAVSVVGLVWFGERVTWTTPWPQLAGVAAAALLAGGVVLVRRRTRARAGAAADVAPARELPKPTVGAAPRP
ncbi:HupE/UreJ family protein [Xylanimonas protaetiae]|uniref:HupE/UreJ family protein n=1 Tax=Xylanimonas protaetiae TaxID=2509457 RepID=A0A4V0YGB7_9MICO|nr:HupE/UreJ family protein [Xylanimonas protaetiae]QAY70651.1 HupE/UreJ family protein [Xylanimonas protaetiae]